MKKSIIISLLSAFTILSCKEVPIIIDNSVRGTDTTYVAAPEDKQIKNFLVEEPSGVTCVNCPAGTELLNKINSEGTFKDRLIIVSNHSGSYTNPVNKGEWKSKYDFRTDMGLQILNGIFGGDPGKPCAGFDRLPLALTGGMTILDYRPNWEKMLATANEKFPTTPVNVKIKTSKIDDLNYNIEVTAAYTEEITGKHGISVYITESEIHDVQEYPTGFKNYVFNDIFRTSVSPWNGLEILKDVLTKEKGRVFVQNFTFTIDENDAKQKTWTPGNMEVVAFVHNLDATDKQVFQAVKEKLVK